MQSPGPNFQLASIIFSELVRSGCTDVVISPGARSGPLAVAAEENKSVSTHIIHDERSAAFFALGISKAQQRPCVLVCTSGTAVAHYLPAVIESFVTGMGLFVISADRPPELHGTGSNQTIEHEQLLQPYVIEQSTLPPPDHPSYLKKAATETNWLWQQAADGPVHLNVQFRKPLFNANSTVQPQETYTVELREPEKVYTVDSRTRSLLETSVRGLIVAGPQHKLCEQRAVVEFLQDSPWPALAECAAGITKAEPHIYLGSSSEFELLKPDVVIHLGNIPTSNKVREFLEETPATVIQIGDHTSRQDTTGFVGIRLKTRLSDLAQQLKTLLKPSEIMDTVVNLNKKKSEVISSLDKGLLTERLLVETTLGILGEEHALYLANSMAVRLTDFAELGNCNVPVGCHRGVSGIDGTIALAHGFAYGLQKSTFLITGDLAFLHDSNSLELLGRSNRHLVIIVLNNKGGGIFHLLPDLHELSCFEKIFGTPHSVELGQLCAAYKVQHSLARDLPEFKQLLSRSALNCRPQVIEVSTQREQTAAELRSLSSKL